MDHTLFKFEGNQGADYLFGILDSLGFDELLIRDVPILQATRDGLVWNQQPLVELKRQVEEMLAPVVEAERVRLRQQDQHARDRVLRERLSKAIVEFNRIADEELGLNDGGGVGTSGERPVEPVAPPMPASGFGFLHEYVNVIVARDASITVRASASVINAGALVHLELAAVGDATLATSSVQLVERKDFPDVLEATVVIRGNRIGSQTLLTARCDGREADCLIQVVAVRTPPPHRPPPSGLFRDLRFDSQEPEPRSRVRYDRESGDIVIQVLAPSVRLYIGEGGSGALDGQGAVLCAELVLEAVCKELARRGVDSGKFMAPSGSGGIAAAIDREYDQLRIKYAEQLHQLVVGETAPPRRGRRPVAESRAAAASPA